MAVAVAETEAGSEVAPATVRVWDPLVRIFHWSLVGVFAFAFATAEGWGTAHEIAGYITVILVGIRILWGLIGTKHARFSDFLCRPSQVIQFLKDSLSFRAKRYIGHNPAGGAMVIAMLLAVIGIAVTGYMMTTIQFWGIEWVQTLHEVLVSGTIGLIVVHVAGVLLASYEHKENLIRSMITGLKRR
jgi:cytochrome b